MCVLTRGPRGLENSGAWHLKSWPLGAEAKKQLLHSYNFPMYINSCIFIDTSIRSRIVSPRFTATFAEAAKSWIENPVESFESKRKRKSAVSLIFETNRMRLEIGEWIVRDRDLFDCMIFIKMQRGFANFENFSSSLLPDFSPVSRWFKPKKVSTSVPSVQTLPFEIIVFCTIIWGVTTAGLTGPEILMIIPSPSGSLDLMDEARWLHI